MEQQQQQQQHQHSSNEGGGNNPSASQPSAGTPAAPKKKPQPEVANNNKKRNYKRDGILFKDFSESDIDTLEEIAGIQNRSVEEIITEVLQPQITSIVDNFQQMKQDLLKKAAADSFKTIKK
jgi:hypothetical protein